MSDQPRMKRVTEFGTPVYAFHVDTWLTNNQAYGIVELAKVIDDPALLTTIFCSLLISDEEAQAIAPAIKALAADLQAQGWK